MSLATYINFPIINIFHLHTFASNICHQIQSNICEGDTFQVRSIWGQEVTLTKGMHVQLCFILIAHKHYTC